MFIEFGTSVHRYEICFMQFKPVVEAVEDILSCHHDNLRQLQDGPTLHHQFTTINSVQLLILGRYTVYLRWSKLIQYVTWKNIRSHLHLSNNLQLNDQMETIRCMK
jgi:hypothetical protein